MQIHVSPDKRSCGLAAANKGGELLRRAIDENGKAAFIVATGASQFDFLEALTGEPDIDWSKTTMYHLDEYIGLGEDHPASFRRYLNERLISIVHPGVVHLVNGQNPDPRAECDRLKKIIAAERIDVAFIGIGENGHLAFNDPPADFETEEPYIVVTLDEACRNQQYGEGWFPTLADVPRTAISMSIAPDHEVRGHCLHRARRPQGQGGQGLLRGRGQPDAPGLPAPDAPRRLHLPGRGLGLADGLM